MCVLIAGVCEKLVLNERAANGCASGVAMQFGYFFAGRDIGILIVEIWRGVQPVGSAVNVSGAMKSVGARNGVHVDMSAAGRALLRVVHRRVDAKFLNSFRGWRG